MDLKRLACMGVFASSLAMFTNGCSDLCCTDFQVGADLSNVDWEIEGEAGAQFAVLAQASADLSGAVSAALNDVTIACRNIAQDLGATNEELDGVDSKEANEKVKAACELAAGKVKGQLGAGVTLKVDFEAPKCEASVKAKADCQAKCSGSAKCDLKANPPTCSGGVKMTVGCSGSCSAEVQGEPFQCKGSCTSTVKGSCTAQGGVKCEGKCEGKCTGEAGVEGGGAQADGTCKGTCEGTCSATAPGVECNGTFEGECKGECKPPSASVKAECNAKCEASAEVEPLKCEGGSIEGGCKVEAKCDANCDASVSAKASCTPPSLAIKATGNVTANVDAVIATLKVNLPNIIVVWKARGQAFVDLVGTVSGSASGAVSGDLGVKGTACLIPIVDALVSSVGGIEATLSASASIGGAAGAN